MNAQDNLMKARDERVSLMNEVLGAIRMIKFMAWERSFESRVHKVRQKELKYQRRNYLIEVTTLPGNVRFIFSFLPPGTFQRYLELLSNLRDPRVFLALDGRSQSNPHPFGCFHICESLLLLGKYAGADPICCSLLVS